MYSDRKTWNDFLKATVAAMILIPFITLFFLFFYDAEGWLDALLRAVGVSMIYPCATLFTVLWDTWRASFELVEIFIHPGTGRSYTCYRKKGRYYYYVNSIRVPEKLYNWL